MYTLKKREGKSRIWPRPKDMPAVVHRLLCSRGIASEEEAEAFLHPAQQLLHDPPLFPGVQEASAILKEAIVQQTRICVYGDYDVDGVSASTILSGALETLGANVFVRIPSREEEGYGLNENAVREIAAQGTGLLVTVDCGISDKPFVDIALELGMQVIVTDHHRAAQERLPRCTIVSAQVGEYPCPYLCGAGVAYKLACALDERFAQEYIDIAALATVADIVPLLGENRTIVARGLAKMNEGLRPGLLALLREAGTEKRRVTEDTLGFQIGPRLNAAGRLGSAMRAYHLLSARSEHEAEKLAKELNEANDERRTLEKHVTQHVHMQLANYDFTAHRAIVLRGEDWNAGVIGIAASRLLEEYHFPVILFAQQDGMLKGSCRSIEGVDIYLALRACEKHLTKYGGHTAAAGLTMPADRFDEFCADLDRYLADNIPPEVWIPAYEFDEDVRLDEIDLETCRAIEMLRPYGMANEQPLFLTEFLPAGVRRIGSDASHLKLTMMDDMENRLDAVWFGHGDEADGLDLSARRRAIGTLQANEFRNVARPQFMMGRMLPPEAEELLHDEKATCVPQSFLTETLYTEKKPVDAQIIDMQTAAALLTENVQGLIFAVPDPATARELYAAFEAAQIAFLPDIVWGEWAQDARCFSAIAICPCGMAPTGVKHVVAVDIDPAFYAERAPSAHLYRQSDAGGMACWLDTLPDIDQLREAYVAARRVSGRPLCVNDEAALCREIAMEAGLPQHAAQASLIALADMELVVIEDGTKLTVPRAGKTDPLQNRVFQNIIALRERRSML